MDRRIVDPNRFLLLGGVTDWVSIFRGRSSRTHESPEGLVRKRGLDSLEILQLRWLSATSLGYPTEPFTVWRRPAGSEQHLAEPPVRRLRLQGWQLIVLEAPQVFVQLAVTGAQGQAVTAWAGAPWQSTVIGQEVPTTTSASVSFSGTAIQALTLPASATVTSLLALDDSVAEDPHWEPIETVALPVDAGWSGVGRFGNPQGLTGAEVDPVEAAMDRFRRGAPLFGWHDELRAGVAAPPWELADPKAMIATLHRRMLPDLLTMVTSLPPEQHATFEVDHTLDAQGGDLPAVLHHRPLEALLYGASTDGLVSLVTGYGTAYEEQLIVDERKGTTPRASHDYMVTSRYEDGVGAEPGPVEFAAILYAPVAVSPPPAPANLRPTVVGQNAPSAPDGPWAPVIRLSWDALATQLGLRVGAYAFAREDVTPAGGVRALMQPRPRDTAVQPLGLGIATLNAAERSAVDDTVRIDPSVPSNTMHHAVAHHDLFGLFSGWSLAAVSVEEPPVDRATLTAARFDVAAGPAGGTCPATLAFDLSWDWATRTPDLVHVAGRLYPQARIGDPPADQSVPPGLAATFGVAGGLLTIDFAPDGTATAGTATPGLSASVRHLSLDGKEVIASPTTNRGPRRYRVEVSGFALDFGATGAIGMALWARGREAMAPGRVGPWSSQPVLASTADPRPPVVVNTREFVQLASLGDAGGRHHAVLEWDAAPGAVGYFAYSCAEAKFLADRGQEPPEFSQTLEQRLSRLRDRFAADPDRRSFSRVNAQPVAGTRLPLVLPRGTKEIHLYVVLGLSAGQIESEWPAAGSPGLRNRFVAFAAPQVAPPTAPQLEVSRVYDDVAGTFRAAVRVKTVPGAVVSRVDLHRVRVPDAAVAVESMGPAVAAVTGTAGAYTATPTVSTERGAAQPLGTVRGLDDVPGSWKTVYYRAVAWSGDDIARGLLGGRSPASAVRTVVVPPAAPPAVEPLTWQPAAGADVVIETATLAPVGTSPLGPHRVTADAHVRRPDGATELVLRYPPAPAPGDPADPAADRLDLVPETAGVLWRGPTAAPAAPGAVGRTPLHLAVPRASFDDVLTVRLRVTDPLGRFTERTIEVPAGVPVQAPDLLNASIVSVIGRGTFLAFETTVPDTDAVGRAYRLEVTLLPRVIFPRPTPRRVRMDLADVPVARTAGNPATDPSPIPVRRDDSRGVTTISAFLRAAGTVTATIAAPDGTTATWTGTTRGL